MPSTDELHSELERVKGVLSRTLDVDLTSDEQKAKAAQDAADAEAAANVETVAEIPVDEYDNKTVAEITPLLEGLDSVQLDTLEAHEVANKNRVTLIDAIAAKRAGVAGPQEPPS